MTRTYKSIKRAVLEHINRSTMRGEPVEPDYNCQVDYERRIPNLINEALMEIRTGVKPDTVAYWLTDGDYKPGGVVQHRLPEDCYRVHTGGVRALDRYGQLQRTNDYKVIGTNVMIVPKGRDYMVEYERYPNLLPDDPDDDTVLDEEPDVIQAAVLYAAAGLVMAEDEFVYAHLRNDYESRISRMMPPVTAEYDEISGASCYNPY